MIPAHGTESTGSSGIACDSLWILVERPHSTIAYRMHLARARSCAVELMCDKEDYEEEEDRRSRVEIADENA
ncbi:unnamed protein product [Alternaria alternata]